MVKSLEMISLGESFGKTLRGQTIHVDSLTNRAWIDEKSDISCEKQHRSCSPTLLLRWLSRYTKEGETDKKELCPMCCILGMKRPRKGIFDHKTMLLIVEMIFRDEHIDTLQKWQPDSELRDICDEVARNLGNKDTLDFIRKIKRQRALEVAITLIRATLEFKDLGRAGNKIVTIESVKDWTVNVSLGYDEARFTYEKTKSKKKAPRPASLQDPQNPDCCGIDETFETIREILIKTHENSSEYSIQFDTYGPFWKEVIAKANAQSHFWKNYFVTSGASKYGLFSSEDFEQLPERMYPDLSDRTDPLFSGLK